MNYKITLITITSLLMLMSCTTQTINDNNSLLWKISGNGLDEPSFLFGTHHLVPVSFLDSISGLEEAFENTKQTVGELDMANMNEMQMKIMSEAVMPQGVTYESLISAEDVVLLDSALTNLLGIGLNQFGALKPAMLSNLISLTLYQKHYPSIANETNIDQYFQMEALNRNRNVVGLETTEDQIEVLLNTRSLERQAELLMCMVRNQEMVMEQMDEFQDAYYTQNINLLYDLSIKETPDDPCPTTDEEMNELNKDRNEKWLEKLPSIMEDKPSFIAVGCLHLPGEVGLIDGLREQGYTVEPVS